MNDGWFTVAHVGAIAALVRDAPEVAFPVAVALLAGGLGLARWRYQGRAEVLEERLELQNDRVAQREEVITSLRAQLEQHALGGAVSEAAQIGEAEPYIEVKSASTLVIDLAAGRNFLVELDRHAAVGIPLHPRVGTFHILVRQAGDKPSTLGWSTAFEFPAGVPTLNLRRGSVDIFRVDAMRTGNGEFSFHATHLTPESGSGATAAAIIGQAELATMPLPAAARAIYGELRKQGLL